MDRNIEEFLLKYDADELRIASEFLSNWLPFLSSGLCRTCTQTLTDRIRSLDAVSSPGILDPHHCAEDHSNCSIHSSGSRKDSVDENDNTDTYSIGSWKDETDELFEPAVEGPSTSEISPSVLASPQVKKSWADMAQEDELADEEGDGSISESVNASEISGHGTLMNGEKPKALLSRDKREYIRFGNVKRKRDFICFERVNGKFVNILDGLELHTGVFSAAEQMRIVRFIEQLQEMGRKGQLKDRTYSEPRKWTMGSGSLTLQFGCCYNPVTDQNGNPPGILKNEIVDPLPHLFKVMIKRLVRWHVVPPTCVPDCCNVDIYEKGDSMPPYIDSHDFMRPFCTVSFLSACEISFGSNQKEVDAGEFAGSFSITLPVGSVLVLNGNGADVSKHCVPAVPAKRISITFRKMDSSKWPIGYIPEPDLQELQPLPDIVNKSRKHNSSRYRSSPRTPEVGRGERNMGRELNTGHPGGRLSGHSRQGPGNRQRF